MLTKEQLAELKEDLVTQKKQLADRIEHDEAEQDQGELSSYDNHPADTATELYDRERFKAIDDHARDEIEKIDAALAAMEEGTYGVCKASGEDIPFERLKAIPTALYSVEHTPDQKLETSRVPSDRIPHGDDGLDSFSDVAQYGTSETPGDFLEDKKGYNDLYNPNDDDDEENPAT